MLAATLISKWYTVWIIFCIVFIQFNIIVIGIQIVFLSVGIVAYTNKN